MKPLFDAIHRRTFFRGLTPISCPKNPEKQRNRLFFDQFVTDVFRNDEAFNFNFDGRSRGKLRTKFVLSPSIDFRNAIWSKGAYHSLEAHRRESSKPNIKIPFSEWDVSKVKRTQVEGAQLPHR